MQDFEYAGQESADHPMKVEMTYRHWPLLRSDQWFLPRFRLRVTNLGLEIRSGSIEIDIANADNLSTLAEITSFKGPFQDVYHHEINSLKAGATDEVTFTIKSKFLKPGRFILRTMFNEWIPSESPIVELRRQIKDANLLPDEKSALEQRAMMSWNERGINLRPTRKRFRVIPCTDKNRCA